MLFNLITHMHLPTPQFSRLVTALAFDLNDPSLDSMILAWDHITNRFLKPIRHHHESAGRIESIRLLAIHDAVHSVFGSGGGYVFTGSPSGGSLDASLAAVAQASHDVLAAVFRSQAQLEDLNHTLEESLALISDEREREAGSSLGGRSATSYLDAFEPFVEKVREVVDGETEFRTASSWSWAFQRSLSTEPVASPDRAAEWLRSA